MFDQSTHSQASCDVKVWGVEHVIKISRILFADFWHLQRPSRNVLNGYKDLQQRVKRLQRPNSNVLTSLHPLRSRASYDDVSMWAVARWSSSVPRQRDLGEAKLRPNWGQGPMALQARQNGQKWARRREITDLSKTSWVQFAPGGQGSV